MIKIKHLGLLAIASSTFLFSGCIYVEDTFPVQDRYYDDMYNDMPRANISLVSYSYPYYYNRPFYYLGGRYYYGGFFRNGFYNYGNRRFRHGHYYSRGYRYHNGRRYRVENGRHGYYVNRDYFERSHHYRHRGSFDRGREYKRKYVKHRKKSTLFQPRKNHIHRSLKNTIHIGKDRIRKRVRR